MSRAAIILNVAVVPVFLSFFLTLTGTASAKTKESPSNATAQRIELPIRLFRGYLVVVEGSVGGLEHQNLLVDTGTAPTILNAKITGALGLALRPATLALPNASVETEAAVLPELVVGPVHATLLPVIVRDLSSLDHQLGIPIAAVIGLDVLGQSSFRLDYSAKKLVFGAVAAQGISLPFEAASPLITVELLAGRDPVHLLVDTGAAGLVFFASRVKHRLALADLSAFRNDTSLSGSFRTKAVNPGELALGGRQFHLARAFLTIDPEDAEKSFDGLLGVGAMGFKSISFDFDLNKIYLQF
jgi:predicted aspartyl protease